MQFSFLATLIICSQLQYLTNMGKFDEAYEFVADQKLDSDDEEVNFKSVYRKVDWRILTLLCGIYFFQFLDMSLINCAAVMGIADNLHGNQFNNFATILFVAYIVCEPISAYLFQILPPAKFFSICVICWGIVVIMHIFCTSYASFMVVRFLLGCFEATVAPGCILITGMWWNHTQQLRRMGLWSIQAGTATIAGGLLSFAFQHVHTDIKYLASWQIFFLAMGLITVVFGIIMYFTLPDNPMQANFLTKAEKLIVLENIRSNQTGTENKTFKWQQVKELLLHDKHTWPMILLTIVSMIPCGAIITFSVTMISNFGFSDKEAALAQMPVGASTIISIVGATYLSAYFNGKYRTYIFISLLVPSIIGYIVMLSTANRIGNLLSVYLINTGTCVITMIYAWNGANTAGHTKRLARNCITIIAFAIGCLIGPQLFPPRDQPRYTTAKIVLLILTVSCIPLVLYVRWISISENAKKEAGDEVEWVKEVGENYEFKDLTDVENLAFRYSY